MYLLQGGVVPLPRWTLYFRFFELLFAIVVLALTAYALSEHGGGPVGSARFFLHSSVDFGAHDGCLALVTVDGPMPVPRPGAMAPEVDASSTPQR